MRDSLMGLFIRGHETTAVLMTWTLYLLAKHPEAQQRVFEEASRVGEAPLSLQRVEEMPFTRQVISESLRLYPPAWSLFMRRLVEPLQLNGYRLPAGAVVMVSPWVIHRQPQLWSDPTTFDPGRFAPDTGAQQHPHAYIPFGGGLRICAGARMAELEAAVILAVLTRRYWLELSEPDREIAITPRPVGGKLLQAIRR